MCVYYWNYSRAVLFIRICFCADDEVYKTNFIESWHRLYTFRKPTIAAISGYAVRLPHFLPKHPTSTSNDITYLLLAISSAAAAKSP